MKRTIIAVISIVLIAFAFTACRQSVVIPFDPVPSNPNTPSEPSVPDYTIQVGDKTYQHLDEAIVAATAGSTIEIGSGTFKVSSEISVSNNITIKGAGIGKTIIEVDGNGVLDVTGDNFTLSNVTISDKSTTFDATRRLIDGHASKIVIDNVRIEGQYGSSISGNVQHYGIVTDDSVTDVTITNSQFAGIRMPITLDFDGVPAYTATVSGNTFDTFEKLSFSNFNESSMSISDNEFGTSTKNFQIELFGAGATAEAAMDVARANNCIVQLPKLNKLEYDANGAVINTVEQLKAFVAGNAGSKARLIEGTFQLDSTISMARDISIVGAGKDKTILEVSGCGAFDVAGSNASISNLTISDKANVETSTKRRLIDVHSSRIVIDNVKLEGQYSTAVSGTPQYLGIVTDKNVSDVTITNSDFIGIRMPISLDFDGVPTYTATVTDNTFDTFEKLSFSNFNESSVSISDNEFGTSTKNFQIELFGTGATSEAAMNIAKTNNCIVQLGVNDTNYNGDGEVTNE